VIVSGKLRAQRAKSMKFKDGYMISSGQPVKEYIDSAVRHVLLRQVSLTCHFVFTYIR
jgi:small subunit ribosomal protein S3e